MNIFYEDLEYVKACHFTTYLILEDIEDTDIGTIPKGTIAFGIQRFPGELMYSSLFFQFEMDWDRLTFLVIPYPTGPLNKEWKQWDRKKFRKLSNESPLKADDFVLPASLRAYETIGLEERTT